MGENTATLADPSSALPAPKLSTKERLADADERSALFDAIIELGSVQRAAESLGLERRSIFRKSREDAEFEVELDAARAVAAEMRYEECMEIADTPQIGETVKTMPDGKQEITTGDMIAHRKLQIDTRMRVAGKLLQHKYGDKPQTEVNISNAIQLVCDEPTRARLIEQRARLLSTAIALNKLA